MIGVHLNHLPIARRTEFDRGGHLAALEVPDLLAEDIRAFSAAVDRRSATQLLAKG